MKIVIGRNFDRNKKKGRVNYAIIGAATGIGIIAGVFAIDKNIEMFMRGVVMLMFSYIFESASHMIYRYYLIKKYEEYVKTYKYSKKKRKK